MNILILAPQPFFQDRGTPIATLKLLRLLAKEGHQLDLLTYHEGQPTALTNCTHHRIPALPFVNNISPGFSWKKLVCDVVMLFCVIRMCFRKQYDMIHAVEESVFIALLIKLVFRTPYVYDMDSSLPQQLQDQMPLLRLVAPLLCLCEREAIRHSHGVVAVCQSLEDIATSYTDRSPIVRVEDASLVTVDSAPDETGDASFLSALPRPLFMYVGNLKPYQGIDLLLDSFTHVFHCDPDAQLVIVGGSEADIRRYRSRAEEIGVAQRTHFLGTRPIGVLASYLDQADVLISPRTLGSNTPMKIFSYLESGRPVLATRLPMHTQVLDEGVSYLVDASPLEMSQGMLTLLDNEALRAEITQGAQKRIQSEFCPDLLDTKLSRFYQQLEDSVLASGHHTAS